MSLHDGIIVQLHELSQVRGENLKSAPIVASVAFLGQGETRYTYAGFADIGQKRLSLIFGNLLQESREVLQRPDTDFAYSLNTPRGLTEAIFEIAQYYGNEILACDFRTNDFSDLVDRVRESLLDAGVVLLCNFQIKLPKHFPMFSSESVDNGRERVAGVEKHIFVGALLACMEVEVNNGVVGLDLVFEGRYKGADVLEGRALHEF